MKKKINIAALALIMVASASAQTIYDGAKFTQKDLNGTARFVGMGGAMGALGGDISTMGTNPAGIGIYRSNDIMGTFGFSSFGSEVNMKDQSLMLIRLVDHLIILDLCFLLKLEIRPLCVM